MADTRPPRPPRDIRRRRHGAGVRSFAAVALAAGVLVAANALSAKGLYAHWGIRPHYALSERTQRVLADTEGELALCAAFERSHPFRTPARRLLREYAEAARTFAGLHLTIREIDLNHDPVEAAALLRRFPSAANAVVVSYRGHDRVLDEYELAAPEGSGGDEAARFDGERAISASILRLAHPVRRTVCFVSGHGEFDPESDHPVGGASALSRALALGARYFMTKPLNVRALAERLYDTALTAAGETPMTAATERVKINRALDERLSNIFITVGIPAHIKGYHYLREAVKLTVENPDIINSITKRLYPAVAARFGTSPSKVERAIRHAIEVAWNKGKIENVNHIFGIKVYSANDKPTNGEFIALVADKLLIEAA